MYTLIHAIVGQNLVRAVDRPDTVANWWAGRRRSGTRGDQSGRSRRFAKRLRVVGKIDNRGRTRDR